MIVVRENRVWFVLAAVQNANEAMAGYVPARGILLSGASWLFEWALAWLPRIAV